MRLITSLTLITFAGVHAFLMVNDRPAWLITRKRLDDKPGRCGLLVYGQDIPEAISYIERSNKPSGVHF